MMTSPSDEGTKGWQRAELLQRAWELDHNVEVPRLVALLEALPERELLEEPELGFLLARNWRRAGKREQALSLIQKLEEPMQRQGPSRLARRRLTVEANVYYDFGEVERARALYLVLLDQSMRAGDDLTEVAALNGIANINALLCRYPEALALYQRCLLISIKHDRRDTFTDLMCISSVYREMGFPQEAEEKLHIALAISDQKQDYDLHAFAAHAHGLLMAQRGEARLATQVATRYYGLIDRERYGLDPQRDATLLYFQAVIARYDQRLQDSRALLDRARSIATRARVRWTISDICVEQVYLEMADGRRAAAQAAAVEAARMLRSMGAEERARRALEAAELDELV